MKQAVVAVFLGMWLFGVGLVAGWASVGDAPWHSSAPEVQVIEAQENNDAMRCEHALKLRATAYNKYPATTQDLLDLFGPRSNTGVFREAIDKAEAEIAQFC